MCIRDSAPDGAPQPAVEEVQAQRGTKRKRWFWRTFLPQHSLCVAFGKLCFTVVPRTPGQVIAFGAAVPTRAPRRPRLSRCLKTFHVADCCRSGQAWKRLAWKRDNSVEDAKSLDGTMLGISKRASLCTNGPVDAHRDDWSRSASRRRSSSISPSSIPSGRNLQSVFLARRVTWLFENERPAL